MHYQIQENISIRISIILFKLFIFSRGGILKSSVSQTSSSFYNNPIMMMSRTSLQSYNSVSTLQFGSTMTSSSSSSGGGADGSSTKKRYRPRRRVLNPKEKKLNADLAIAKDNQLQIELRKKLIADFGATITISREPALTRIMNFFIGNKNQVKMTSDAFIDYLDFKCGKFLSITEILRVFKNSVDASYSLVSALRVGSRPYIGVAATEQNTPGNLSIFFLFPSFCQSI
jgi:hypothetical protein